MHVRSTGGLNAGFDGVGSFTSTSGAGVLACDAEVEKGACGIGSAQFCIKTRTKQETKMASAIDLTDLDGEPNIKNPAILSLHSFTGLVKRASQGEASEETNPRVEFL